MFEVTVICKACFIFRKSLIEISASTLMSFVIIFVCVHANDYEGITLQ